MTLYVDDLAGASLEQRHKAALKLVKAGNVEWNETLLALVVWPEGGLARDVGSDTFDMTDSSYTCVEPGCDRSVPSPRGRYARCEDHRAARAVAKAGGGSANGDGFVAGLDTLKALARDADRKRARAADLTAKALAAKREADDAAELVREKIGELAGVEYVEN